MTLNEIRDKLKAPKNQRNTFGNYNYRSCEDILEAVKPLLEDSSLTITDEVREVGGRFYVVATATFLQDGNMLSVQGWAREAENKKGMDDAQITGAASSYARKYALNGLFLIDDTKDADATNKHGKEAPQKTSKPAKPAPKSSLATSPEDTAKKLIQAFDGLSVSQSELERYLGHAILKSTPEEFDDLRKQYSLVKSGKRNWSDISPYPEAALDELAASQGE